MDIGQAVSLGGLVGHVLGHRRSSSSRLEPPTCWGARRSAAMVMAMNYRHAFHAGNFADLIKHAVLTHIMRALTVAPGALTVIDTHAGAGLYDLAGAEARRTGEAEAGVVRLMADAEAPAAFADLRAAVRRANAPAAVTALWTPIKDLASFDALLTALEDAAAGAPILMVEVRPRALADPMAM